MAPNDVSPSRDNPAFDGSEEGVAQTKAPSANGHANGRANSHASAQLSTTPNGHTSTTSTPTTADGDRKKSC